MTTTKITVTDYLAEYMAGKYGNHSTHEAIQLPDGIDLYFTVYDLMQRRPKNVSQTDEGNLWLCLPCRRYPGKDPQYFNYLSLESAKMIDKTIATMFFAELHELMDSNKHVYGITYENSVYYFINKYALTKISADGLIKHHKRWRDKTRKKDFRRNYTKKTA